MKRGGLRGIEEWRGGIFAEKNKTHLCRACEIVPHGVHLTCLVGLPCCDLGLARAGESMCVNSQCHCAPAPGFQSSQSGMMRILIANSLQLGETSKAYCRCILFGTISTPGICQAFKACRRAVCAVRTLTGHSLDIRWTLTGPMEPQIH